MHFLQQELPTIVQRDEFSKQKHGVFYETPAIRFGFDSSILGCKITITKITKKHYSVDNLTTIEQEMKAIKKKDDCSLLKSGLLSDCQIVCGEKSFNCHKNILSLRSEVFSTMFTSGLKEDEQATVEIKDFDPEIVEQMLEYIYTGEV